MAEIQLLSSAVPNLDTVLGGGIPSYSLKIIAGPPGAGKTTLTQQMLFQHVREHHTAKRPFLRACSTSKTTGSGCIIT